MWEKNCAQTNLGVLSGTGVFQISESKTGGMGKVTPREISKVDDREG